MSRDLVMASFLGCVINDSSVVHTSSDLQGYHMVELSADVSYHIISLGIGYHTANVSINTIRQVITQQLSHY